MRKHPVDDLFARKLSDWQPKASADLWKRIEDRQEKKSYRLRGGYWYAAASVALVLMAGYVVWQNQPKVQPVPNQGLATVDQTWPAKGGTSDLKVPSQDSTRAVANAEVMIAESKMTAGDGSLPDQAQHTKTSRDPAVQPQVPEPHPVTERIEVAAIQKNTTKPESLIPDSKSETSLAPLEDLPEITGASMIEQDNGRVIIAHIETDNENQKDQKTSKFIRILRQLKNAKQGEAIEWDEVGFNPKRLIARADERLRNEEEKVSKKYQELKDKTKL